MDAPRPALATDAALLASIHATAFPKAEQWNANVIGLQLGLLGGFGFLHPAGGMVLARVAADEAEILTLAVRPERRRSGLGRALLLTAMAEATARGARAMFLEVRASNEAARALYAAAGFTRVGTRARYYPDGADALVLRASLLPPDGG